MVTISQLANAVGVTVRTVRHYHARGLLAEPRRDASGYRRYGFEHALALIRIRALADGGVPLSRVAALEQAPPEEFADALEQIDADISARVAELREHQRRLRMLLPGDRLVLPDYVLEYLDRLREEDIGEESIRAEREGWILLSVTNPDQVRAWISLKMRGADDPTFMSYYRRMDELVDLDPHDPRVDSLARDLLDYGRQNQHLEYVSGDHLPLHPVVVTLLDDRVVDISSAWERLGRLLREHDAWMLDERGAGSPVLRDR